MIDNDTFLSPYLLMSFSLVDYRLLLTCVIVISWGIYISLYNSRIFGMILTFVINKLYKGPHIKFGKWTQFSV